MAERGIGILGLGYQLPAQVRLNDDPIFDELKKNSSQKEILALFQGFARRHVLGPDEQLVAIMAAAAEKAMIDAGVTPADIDLLIGCASLSRYIVPTDLGALHARLTLPQPRHAAPARKRLFQLSPSRSSSQTRCCGPGAPGPFLSLSAGTGRARSTTIRAPR